MSSATRDLGQRRRVDDALAQIGELPLGQVGELAVGEVGDDPSEHRVAEELEPFVRRLAAGDLGAPRAVRHRPAQQRRIR